MLISSAFAADAPASTTSEVMLADPSAQPPVSSERMMTETLLMLGLMFAIFYFILIRPQQKRLQAHKDMIAGVQKGSKVITGGGILGTVIKQESDNILQVEIAPNVRVLVARTSITEVLEKGASTTNDN